VASWLILRGRCRDCGQPISVRYPLVEALTAILFVAAYARFGYSLLTVKALVFVSLLILTAFIDYDHQIIPFGLSLPGLTLGLAAGFVMPPGVRGSLLGAGAGLAFVVVAWLLWRFVLGPIWRRHGVNQREGIGGGDLPYAAMLGAFLGLKGLAVALFAAVIFGIVFGYVQRARGRARKGQPMPFGPFLALGGLLGLFFGTQLFTAYARLVGLQ
jgi:leader peptidase (prepilin peptidase)/N-methyltransferase